MKMHSLCLWDKDQNIVYSFSGRVTHGEAVRLLDKMFEWHKEAVRGHVVCGIDIVYKVYRGEEYAWD